tara:strand:+ start:693 stop:1001 length:309 start_codon:yes stop_codon:yes gene_type:complete
MANDLPIVTIQELKWVGSAINQIGSNRSRWDMVAMCNVGPDVYMSKSLRSTWTAIGRGKVQVSKNSGIGELAVVPDQSAMRYIWRDEIDWDSSAYYQHEKEL